MENKELQDLLEGIINAKRVYRDKAANAILAHQELLSDLVDKTFDIEDPLHIRAAWVLELVCIQDCSLLNDHIDKFIKGMSRLNHESALRPVSKICWLWSKYYFSTFFKKNKLNESAVEQIISCNFNWLIEEHKVATQVYAMDSLYLWGQGENWILEELKSILEQHTNSGTSGYRAHARKLLKNLSINDV